MKRTPPPSTNSHPGRGVPRSPGSARLVLALLAVGSMAAIVLGVGMSSETGSQTTDQALLVLRTVVVALAAWLLVSVVLAIVWAISNRPPKAKKLNPVANVEWSAQNRATSHTGSGSSALGPASVSRNSLPLCPKWVRALANQAFGAVTVVAVLTASAAAAGAAGRDPSTRPESTATLSSTLTPSTQLPTTTLLRRVALGAPGAGDEPQLFVVDPSSGQQWPIIAEQAQPPQANAVTTNLPSDPARKPSSGNPRPTVGGVLQTPSTTNAPVKPPASSTTPATPAPTRTPTPTSPATSTSTSTSTTTTTSLPEMTNSKPTGPPDGVGYAPPLGPQVPAAAPGIDTTGGGPTNHVVKPGDSFWTIAETVVYRANPTAGDQEVAEYWEDLMRVNAAHLPVPDNPDLLFPGTVVRLPDR